MTTQTNWKWIGFWSRFGLLGVVLFLPVYTGVFGNLIGRNYQFGMMCVMVAALGGSIASVFRRRRNLALRCADTGMRSDYFLAGKCGAIRIAQAGTL